MAKRFSEFDLGPEVLRAVQEAGYTVCTPVQEKAIGPILEGHDLTGLAETGSGKTAAFLLPILDRMKLGGEDPRALVVAPTRELALQVAGEAVKLGAHRQARIAAIYGGTGLGSQKNQLLSGVDLVVGTPGRLIDFIQQTYLRLSRVRYLVLDEADRMLDMGFIKDVEFIVSRAPLSRQTLLFSATLPPEILALADRFMFDPVRVEVERPLLTAQNIEQTVFMVDDVRDKMRVLRGILRNKVTEQALVFVSTREMTVEVAEQLRRDGEQAASISSLLSQTNRERVLSGFRDRSFRVLVATDVAGRGLDIDSISHVINFDVPGVPDDYVHRVGRTGRAGRKGRAITLVGRRDRPLLANIEAHLGVHLSRETSKAAAPSPGRAKRGGARATEDRGRGRGGSRGPGRRRERGSGSGRRGRHGRGPKKPAGGRTTR
ncbi:MAG: DEAD/DEAH box helicase [Acidobacteriota bacterium]